MRRMAVGWAAGSKGFPVWEILLNRGLILLTLCLIGCAVNRVNPLGHRYSPPFPLPGHGVAPDDVCHSSPLRCLSERLLFLNTVAFCQGRGFWDLCFV